MARNQDPVTDEEFDELRKEIDEQRDQLHEDLAENLGGDSDDYDGRRDVDDYGWSLVQKKQSPLDENTEIVGMDTRHGQPHLDKEYLPPDADGDKKEWLEDDYGFYRMRDYLLENWKTFADLHIYYNE
jgi:hypothetical protein